jgi:hypothetical protein
MARKAALFFSVLKCEKCELWKRSEAASLPSTASLHTPNGPKRTRPSLKRPRGIKYLAIWGVQYMYKDPHVAMVSRVHEVLFGNVSAF